MSSHRKSKCNCNTQCAFTLCSFLFQVTLAQPFQQYIMPCGSCGQNKCLYIWSNYHCTDLAQVEATFLRLTSEWGVTHRMPKLSYLYLWHTNEITINITAPT